MIEFGIDQKICYKCKVEKPISEFSQYKSICKSCNKEYMRKYYLKNKEKLDYKNRQWYYDNIDRRKIYDSGYYNTEVGRQVRKRAFKKYNNTLNGKLINIRKSNKRRKKHFRCLELFINPLPKEIEVNYHHINDMIVVPIPRITHEYCYTGKDVNSHREECNEWINKLYGLDVVMLLSNECR